MLATRKPTSPTPSSSTGDRLRREDADLHRLVVLPFGHQPDLHARPQHAVDHADDDDDAAVGVVPGVEDQRLERRVGIAGRRRQARDDRLENLRRRRCPASRWRGSRRSPSRPMMSVNLAARLLGLRARQIDLVDDRDDLEVVLDRQVGVGQRLRLDALRRVDQQQRAFAGGQRPRDFVREVDVPRRVDQVEDVLLAVVRRCSCRRTGCALMVMPRSRSRSIASRTCASISRACSAPVISRKRSASVDLP